jgi:hypothetical protein
MATALAEPGRGNEGRVSSRSLRDIPRSFLRGEKRGVDVFISNGGIQAQTVSEEKFRTPDFQRSLWARLARIFAVLRSEDVLCLLDGTRTRHFREWLEGRYRPCYLDAQLDVPR